MSALRERGDAARRVCGHRGDCRAVIRPCGRRGRS